MSGLLNCTASITTGFFLNFMFRNTLQLSFQKCCKKLLCITTIPPPGDSKAWGVLCSTGGPILLVNIILVTSRAWPHNHCYVELHRLKQYIIWCHGVSPSNSKVSLGAVTSNSMGVLLLLVLSTTLTFICTALATWCRVGAYIP